MATRETFQVWDNSDEMWALEGEEFSSLADAKDALLEEADDNNWEESDCVDGFTVYKKVAQVGLSAPKRQIVDMPSK